MQFHVHCAPLTKNVKIIKGRPYIRTKSRKIDLLLVRKISALAQPPPALSVRAHHKFRKIRGLLHQKVRTSASEEHPSPLSAKCPHWTNPLPPDCGRFLWTAPYIFQAKMFCWQGWKVHMIKEITTLYCI